MLKEGTFLRKKYFALFLGCIVGSLFTGINSVLDGILSGNMLGESALAAVSLVTPLFNLSGMIGNLFSPGYATLYGQYSGNFDKKNAYKIAGEGIITTLIMSTLIALILFLSKDAFLNFYGCTNEIYEYASVYYNWMIAGAFVGPWLVLMFYYLTADGDTLLISISSTSQIILNVVLSFFLVKYFGIAGLGMGRVIAYLVGTLTCVIHFIKKSNSFHFNFGINIKNFFKAVSLSVSIAASYLFIALTDIIMNKIIIMHCGSNMIPVYAIINFVIGSFMIFDAVFLSANGLASSFYGEYNIKALKKTMKLSIKYIIKIGLACSIALLICAPLLPKLYGMESQEVIDASIRAARFLAIETIPYGICLFMECIYPSFEKTKLGVFVTFLNDFCGPVALSLILMNFLGFDAVIFGMSLNGLIIIPLFAIVVTLILGRKGFPLYLNDYGLEILSYDYEVNENTFTVIRDKVLEELNKRNIKIKNVDLLIEELYKRIYEKNKGKKVITEITLMFANDYTYIITRDDGEIFNFVDANSKVVSLNAHVLNSLLETIKHKDYIVTLSYNRNGFKFLKNEE